MKKIILATVVMAAMSTAATAENMFAFMGDQDASNVIIIEPLTASADGYIAVYDNHTDTIGELLGVARVYEGANNQTRVQVGRTVRKDVIAFLFAGNDFSDPTTAVDSIKIDIDN
jgi:hypothetical protein